VTVYLSQGAGGGVHHKATLTCDLTMHATRRHVVYWSNANSMYIGLVHRHLLAGPHQFELLHVLSGHPGTGAG